MVSSNEQTNLSSQICNNFFAGGQKIGKEILDNTQKTFSGIHTISPEIFFINKTRRESSVIGVYLELSKPHAITTLIIAPLRLLM